MTTFTYLYFLIDYDAEERYMNHLESNLIKESGYSADVESSSSVSSDSESSDSACHTSKGIDCEHFYEFFL